MKKYLVIADNNEQSEGKICSGIERGIELAKLSGAAVHIVGFAFDNYDSEQTTQKNIGDFRRAVIMTREKTISTILQQVDTENLELTSEVVWAENISKWLIEETKTNQYSMIIKAGHRTESFNHTPTDWVLFRESPIPVMIVDKNKFKARHKILCALDLGSKKDSHQQLNSQVIQQGKALAEILESELFCCYAIPVSPILVDLDIVSAKKIKTKETKKAQKRFAKLAEKFDLDPKILNTKAGDAEKVVPSIANRLKAEMVVIGTVRRKGIKGKLIGNTAEKVLHNLHTDLLVVNPDQ